MTATATKTTTPSILERKQREAEELFTASEQIWSQIIDEGREHVYPAERVTLTLAGYDNLDHYAMRHTIGRKKLVRELMRQAGSAAEYAAAKSAFENARAAEAEHVSDPLFVKAVRGAIASRAAAASPSAMTKTLLNAHAKLQALVDAREQTEATLAAMDAVRERLRDKDLLPPFVVGKWGAAKTYCDTELHRRRHNLFAELQKLEAIDDGSDEAAERRAGVEAELARVQAELDGWMSEVNVNLNFYVDQL